MKVVDLQKKYMAHTIADIESIFTIRYEFWILPEKNKFPQFVFISKKTTGVSSLFP